MSVFRTVDLSDPRFESDHLRYMTIKTSSLKGRGDICIFVPPGIRRDQPLPLVILLHGVYGSAWAWTHKAGVHLQAVRMIEQGEIPPMIIAMPSDGLWGDGSGYLEHNGFNFEKWIAEDVVNAIISHIPGADRDSPLFIAGLSMGGFGALRIGAKYGGLFKGIAGHSSITNLIQMKLFVEEDVSNYLQQQKEAEDVFQTFLFYKDRLPPIRFDCGVDDQLIEYNRELHRKMLLHSLPHEYEEFPGAHDWSYWENNVGKTLTFFGRQL